MSELARWNDDGTLTLGSHAARARVELKNLQAADGHRIDCTFLFSIQPVDRAADRRMLEEVFRVKGAGSVRIDDVCAHLKPELLAAAGKIIITRAADEWLARRSDDALRDALVLALRSATFTCGIEALAPFQIDLHSPTVEQDRLEQMRRDLADRHLVARRERMQHSAEIMAQFARLRAEAPDMPAGRLLEQLDASNSAGLLETLLIACAGETTQPRSLWMVAGNELACVSPEDGSVQSTATLPDTLGPCRSISAAKIEGRDCLLIGARSGVMIVDPHEPGRPPRTFCDNDLSSQLGFNRAAFWNSRLYATHGDAGLVAWELDDGARPASAVRPESGDHPRHLTALDDERLIYSGGEKIVVVHRGGEATAHDLPGEIIAILPCADEVLVVTAAGDVHRWDRHWFSSTEPVQRHSQAPLPMRFGRPITAAALLPWLDEPRLLLATIDGPVVCAGLNDSVTTQYLSPHRGFRALGATHRSVVALSADRQRLIFWNSWNGRAPVNELHAARRFKHRVADFCFA